MHNDMRMAVKSRCLFFMCDFHLLCRESHRRSQSGTSMSHLLAFRLLRRQKGGQVLAGGILGLSLGSLFALVYAFGWSSLPGSNGTKKGLFLAAVMWFTIFLLPFLKYPSNPPAVGDPETLYYRQSLYLLFIAASGLGALGLAFLYKRLGDRRLRKFAVATLYAAYISALFVMMPPNPDPITIPSDLVNNFRIASALTVTLFWFLLGATFGAFWDRFKPQVRIRSKF